jgi:hypothetical protein
MPTVTWRVHHRLSAKPILHFTGLRLKRRLRSVEHLEEILSASEALSLQPCSPPCPPLSVFLLRSVFRRHLVLHGLLFDELGLDA